MYEYSKEKPKLFSEENAKLLLRMYSRMKALCNVSGSVTMGKAIEGFTGSSFLLMAAVDYLVESGWFKEIKSSDVAATQYRVFVLTERNNQ